VGTYNICTNECRHLVIMQAKEDIAKRRCGSPQVADGWSIEIALYTHYTYIYIHNIYIVMYRGIYT